MSKSSKSARLKALSRVEGQIRGLARMVEDDRYCIDLVTQISAARAALARIEREVLEEHISHCVERAISGGNANEQRKVVGELMTLLQRTER